MLSLAHFTNLSHTVAPLRVGTGPSQCKVVGHLPHCPHTHWTTL